MGGVGQKKFFFFEGGGALSEERRQNKQPATASAAADLLSHSKTHLREVARLFAEARVGKVVQIDLIVPALVSVAEVAEEAESVTMGTNS